MQDAGTRIQDDTEGIFHQENDTDIRLERVRVIGHTAKVGTEQGTNTIQTAEQTGEDADKDQHQCGLFHLFWMKFTQQHFDPEQDNDETEDRFYNAGIDVF